MVSRHRLWCATTGELQRQVWDLFFGFYWHFELVTATEAITDFELRKSPLSCKPLLDLFYFTDDAR